MVVTGCDSPVPDTQGKSMKDIEKISRDITESKFLSIDDLKRYIEQLRLDYTLGTETDPLLVVAPSQCKIDARGDFRYWFLRLEGVKGAKVYRYRIYKYGENPLCIEKDFGFKNPYQQ